MIKKFFSLINLWLSSENKWINISKFIKENYISDRETILLLKKNPKIGIVRYGNSELGLIVGNSPRTQKYNKELKKKLVNICQKYNSDLSKKFLLAMPIDSLIIKGINRNLPKWYPGIAAKYAMKFLIKKNEIYGSPFCFRVTEVIDKDIKDYIELIKSLFFNRQIIYVGPMEGKNAEIPSFIEPLVILKIPKENAFEKFDDIINKIKNVCQNYKDPLVVIVGGITATALSYELNMLNITCYDFGQYLRTYKNYEKNSNNEY